ncbi:5'-nucleotidase [Sphingomonas sp. A2-49]|uniref:5'-nucleotidase n=1 Tax=Sphingomonas sp. A2-49 TaxID=1391375 RepID=UPI0021D1CEF1|nr:5'-nucleotidase [Sphingomonas sp. A2-49]MCU6455626.1 5'-nucleotidase [Sphingomonas sp. A2-49]
MQARMAMALALQAAPVAGPPVPAELRPARAPAPAVPCGSRDDGGDIVVCARARDADRLRPVAEGTYARRPLRAETGVAGKLRVAAEAEQGVLPNGQSAPRAMMRLKLPF